MVAGIVVGGLFFSVGYVRSIDALLLLGFILVPVSFILGLQNPGVPPPSHHA